MLRISPDKLTVLEKVIKLDDSSRCLAAYNFLKTSKESSYAHFVRLRENVLAGTKKFNCYSMENTMGIECALWSHLYPFTNWCDTVITGSKNRSSQKMSFMTKVLSSIICYSLEFELLHFHYDRWIFKTVTGAITTARRFKCSPARSLDEKTFSVGYWQWQHRILLDAVAQFGLPSVFVTISPYEWTFPWPLWLSDIR